MFSITKINPIEKDNQRILTTAQLAEAYGTDEKIIRNNFNRNKERYTESVHYFCLKGADLQAFKTTHQFDVLFKHTNMLYLWTEKGALLHAKSLNTEKAWEVYNYLVDFYFRAKANQLSVELADLKLRYNAAIDKICELSYVLIKHEMTEVIEQEQWEELRNITRDNVFSLLGENTVSYRVMSRALYREIWYNYRKHFHLDSYKNTPKHRFAEGVKFLEDWEPDDELFSVIEELEEAFEGYMSRYFDDFDRDGYAKLLADYPVIMEDFINALRSDS